MFHLFIAWLLIYGSGYCILGTNSHISMNPGEWTQIISVHVPDERRYTARSGNPLHSASCPLRHVTRTRTNDKVDDGGQNKLRTTFIWQTYDGRGWAEVESENVVFDLWVGMRGKFSWFTGFAFDGGYFSGLREQLGESNEKLGGFSFNYHVTRNGGHGLTRFH